LRFDLDLGVAVGDGVGEVFSGFGEAVGVGVGVAFLDERFRCLRDGVGVGVVVRNFLIFVPNGSSALIGKTFIPQQIAVMRRLRKTMLVAGNKISERAPAESLCSGECRLQNFREENSHLANVRGNQATPVP
jgi:hypothetical protein